MDSLNSDVYIRVVFTGKDQVETVRETVPTPGATQVVVQARKTLISTGTECICLQRKFEPGSHWDNWVKYPFFPGYSFAGVVVEAGNAAASLRIGDRVALRAGHRQFVVADAAAAMPIPDEVSDESATWYGLANIVQNGVRRAEHELGDTVVVIGLGQIGQLVVQYSRLLGARHVIAVDVAAKRIESAEAHGATHGLAMTVAEAADAIREITGGRMADVVYDVTGHPAVFSAALPLVRRFGKLLLLGDTGAPSEQRLTGDVVTRGLRIIGAHDTNPPSVASDHAYWSHANMAQLFFAYLARGDMRVGDLVTHRFPADQAPEAYHLLTTDRAAALGVIIDWSSL